MKNVKELNVHVYENITLGLNDTWVYETDPETFEEWKVYIEVDVKEIISVSVNLDKPDGLECKVMGIVIK